MSKITNDGLTRSGTTGCFLIVPIWQQWASIQRDKRSTLGSGSYANVWGYRGGSPTAVQA